MWIINEAKSGPTIAENASVVIPIVDDPIYVDFHNIILYLF